MNMWEVTMRPERGESRGKVLSVQADTVRMANATKDMWFCDEKDKRKTDDYLPKLIIAYGDYSMVKRIEQDNNAKMEIGTDKVKEEKIDWV